MILDELLAVIRDDQRNQPRTLQEAIGPSELAEPCDHCLAARLAGWARSRRGDAWLPYIGTAVHAQLADAFGGRTGYLVEHRVTVGELDGVPVIGTADLYDETRGIVIDFKVVGLSTLNEARRHGASAQYRGQVALYGRGFERDGHRVTSTAIVFLPRNSPNLSDAVIVERAYDSGEADAVLERAQELADRIHEVERVSVTARDILIDSLPRAAGCHRCGEYPRLTPEEAPTVGALLGTTKEETR